MFLTRIGRRNDEAKRRSTTDDSRKREALTKRIAGRGRKSRSLKTNDSTQPMSGVFASSRTLSTTTSPPPSQSSMSLGSSRGSLCHPGSWKSSGEKGHHRNSPLVAENPDREDDKIVDAAERLGMAMARSRKLPDTWYFSSNHILVNQERSKRVIAPLIRMRGLDDIARLHAEQMAAAEDLHHLDLDALRLALKDINYRRLGANVQRGESIRGIHAEMINVVSNKNNILDRRFTHMGMGTAIGKDGKLYLCQVYRG